MNDRERRHEARVTVGDLSWPVRSEVSKVAETMVAENISRAGACVRLDRRSARAEKMLQEALAAPYLVEVVTGDAEGARLALLRWGTADEHGRRRFGLEWIEPHGRAWVDATSNPRPSRQAAAE
jgi:hypothetical protein